MSLDNTHPCSFCSTDCFSQKESLDGCTWRGKRLFFSFEKKCTRLPSCHFYIYVDISFCGIFNLKINVTNCVSSIMIRKESMIFFRTDDPIGCLPFMMKPMILCFPLRYHQRVNLICIHYQEATNFGMFFTDRNQSSVSRTTGSIRRNIQDYCTSSTTRTMMTMRTWKMEKMLMRKMLRRGNDSQESFPESTVMTRRGWEKERRRKRERERGECLFSVFHSFHHDLICSLFSFLSVSSWFLVPHLDCKKLLPQKKASPLHENGRQCITIFSLSLLIF